MESPIIPEWRLELLELRRRVDHQEQVTKRLEYSLQCALELLGSLKQSVGGAQQNPFPQSSPPPPKEDTQSDGAIFPTPWIPPSPRLTEVRQSSLLLSAPAPREAAATNTFLDGGMKVPPNDTATVRSGVASPRGSDVGFLLDEQLRVDGARGGRAAGGTVPKRGSTLILPSPPPHGLSESGPLPQSGLAKKSRDAEAKAEDQEHVAPGWMKSTEVWRHIRTIDWSQSLAKSSPYSALKGWGSICFSLLCTSDTGSPQGALPQSFDSRKNMSPEQKTLMVVLREIIGFATMGKPVSTAETRYRTCEGPDESNLNKALAESDTFLFKCIISSIILLNARRNESLTTGTREYFFRLA
uniref:Uncharacterized protein n=1 Tax=Chromera velia CCMP2878 TaxID=1169474 RepID=A0A0G4I3L7_9ALVE|eukprot:Cvel_10693.t1-p1 / transcript=Cvel_10693.t1 / gene=Cvel_10693 / organism=Chromera_velia_CCMP2878 / gene_product=hypothetical protein / transcript_product=hypothetical protein / location=Cvel_scaffold650:31986-33047(+) / protein_length=354 / sequence_SO=supercontig / SO=protein_coding / is_pseudo=false